MTGHLSYTNARFFSSPQYPRNSSGPHILLPKVCENPLFAANGLILEAGN
jgi:hypothetical protein